MSNKDHNDNVDWWVNWLVDAIATATQNRALLRGDCEEDQLLTEALLINAKHAIKQVVIATKQDHSDTNQLCERIECQYDQACIAICDQSICPINNQGENDNVD